MITPILEKLILQGNAVFRTITGTGQQFSYLVPDNKRAVIVGIDVETFYDTPGSTTDLNDIFERLLHQLRVTSKNSNNIFVYRGTCIVLPTETGLKYVPFGAKHFDTYLTVEGNVIFETTHAPIPQRVTGWTAASAVTNTRTEVKPTPQGYGNAADPGAIAVIQRLNYNPALSPIQVVNRMNPNQGNPSGLPVMDGLQFPATADTNLWGGAPDFLDPDRIFRMPIVNVQVVEINNFDNQYFKGSF